MILNDQQSPAKHILTGKCTAPAAAMIAPYTGPTFDTGLPARLHFSTKYQISRYSVNLSFSFYEHD